MLVTSCVSGAYVTSPDTVELVVSELVTNADQAAMTHQGPPCAKQCDVACVHVRLASDRMETLVEVWDGNPRLPRTRHSTPDDEGGRGLMLVAALSKQWGWDMPIRGYGKVVWALIDGSTSDAQRTTAARVMEVFPAWWVMWGTYSPFERS
jgi:hypothetical protein